MKIKNSNDNIRNRTRDLPACSAAPQPTAPPRGPFVAGYRVKFTLRLKRAVPYLVFNTQILLVCESVNFLETKKDVFRRHIPVVLYGIIKYKQKYKHNSINDFYEDTFLHCYFQWHVLALVVSHLQVDYFFLVRYNIQLSMLLLLLPTRQQ